MVVVYPIIHVIYKVLAPSQGRISGCYQQLVSG